MEEKLARIKRNRLVRKMDLILRKLNSGDEEIFLRSLERWDNHPDFLFSQGFLPSMTFQEYLSLLDSHEKGELLPEGYVPYSTFCGFGGQEIVGRVSLRHQLNDFLYKRGGNIGYGVLPDYRFNGYGREMLLKALVEAKKLGLLKVLLTCDKSNIGSIRTIESNGGVLENQIDSESILPLRYWIDLN